jgi:hypothetical protein
VTMRATSSRRRKAVEPDVEPEPVEQAPAGDGEPGSEPDALEAEEDDDPDPERYRHTVIHGVAVVGDRPVLSGLVKGSTGEPVPIRGTRVLTLADGRRSYVCRDCDFVGELTMTDKDRTQVIGTRGEVRTHRADKHGATRAGRPRRRGDGGQQEELPIGVDPAMSTLDLDPAVMALELGEVLMLAAEIGHWERTYGAVLADRDDWKARALAAERELRQIRRTLGRLLPTGEGE